MDTVLATARPRRLRSRSGNERLFLRTHDQQPEHGAKLGQKRRLEVTEESVRVIRSEEPSHTQDNPGDAVKQEPVPEPARQEARTHDQRSKSCLLYTSPSPRDGLLSRMPSSA